jgi:NTP pyrophosphatase (non-canonical NTP hydrolase)
MSEISFSALRAANDARQQEWPGNDQADIPFRAIEVAGEFGEVCEAVKKLLRAQRGIKGSTATLEDVGDEMADAIISLDLLASRLGIDLGEAVARKFDRTSEKYGLKTRMPRILGGDVAELVIAARETMDAEGSPESIRKLDAALEAFAASIPYEDQP